MLENDPYLFGSDDFVSKKRLFHQFAFAEIRQQNHFFI